jgi:hypothetical protein
LNSNTRREEIHWSMGYVLLSLVDECSDITVATQATNHAWYHSQVSLRFPMPCSTSDLTRIPVVMNGRIVRIRLGSVVDLGIIVHLCGPSHLSDGPDIVQVCTRRSPPHALHCLALPLFIRFCVNPPSTVQTASPSWRSCPQSPCRRDLCQLSDANCYTSFAPGSMLGC